MILTGGVYKKIAKNLELDKPLVIFDIETTGLSISSDKIIELAYIKIWESGKVKKDSFYINPETEIPDEASVVHGITNEMVAGKKTFKERSQELWDIFHDCYYGGFNVINFDLMILRREFVRVGMDFEYKTEQVIDSKEIFRRMAPGNIASAYEYYCWKGFKQRQDSMKHTEAAAEILAKQLERYNEIHDWKFINKLHQGDEDIRVDNIRKFYWRHGEPHFAFSKYKDKALSWVVEHDRSFLEWIVNSDFTEETKTIVQMALDQADKKKNS